MVKWMDQNDKATATLRVHAIVTSFSDKGKHFLAGVCCDGSPVAKISLKH